MDQLLQQVMGGDEGPVGGEEGLLVEVVVLVALRGQHDQSVKSSGSQEILGRVGGVAPDGVGWGVGIGALLVEQEEVGGRLRHGQLVQDRG